MTIAQLHIAFDVELDKTLDFEYPYILAEQKDYWLNKAQDRFIKQRAFGNNLYRTTFEETEKSIDDLRAIVVESTISTTLTSGLYTAILPVDYMYLVRHRCTTTSECASNNLVSGIQVRNDEINNYLKDPFRKPIADEPLYYIQGNTINYEVPDADFTISNARITYIRRPAEMRLGTAYVVPTTDVQCELADSTHREILDIAIAMILENIESPRYQTNLNELNKTE